MDIHVLGDVNSSDSEPEDFFVPAGMTVTQPFVSAWQLRKYLAQHGASVRRATARIGQVLLMLLCSHLHAPFPLEKT